MRKKRNRNNKRITASGYIKLYFQDDIETILTPSNRFLHNCENPYVKHDEAEAVLTELKKRNPLKDQFIYFTGLTGSGKTTIIRHVFEYEDNNSMPFISDQMIVIPIDFNRSNLNAQSAINSKLVYAIEKICNAYSIDYPDEENHGFYDYIEHRRGDLLRISPDYHRNDTYSTKMTYFKKTMPIEFASFQLQYVMDQEKCNVNLVIFILDNVEAFINKSPTTTKYYDYIAPVIEANKLAYCITQRPIITKWSFNMIIACRHHILRLVRGAMGVNNEESILLQSFSPTGHSYDLANPVRLNAIIDTREAVFSVKRFNKERWANAVRIVNKIISTADWKIGDYILEIVLKDLRKSMDIINDLVMNKSLQRVTNSELVGGAFNIDSTEQFDLSRVNLIRLIGLGDYEYYSSSDTLIPNLLYNKPKEGFELYPLLTLKLFLEQCNYYEPTWDNSISIPQIKEIIESMFDGTSAKAFHESIIFLIKNRLLLRSADQPQDEVPGLSNRDLQHIDYVYVSGKAISLWKELSNSSALFQLFIDDIWMDEESDCFGNGGNDIEHCLSYLEYLYEVEIDIVNMVYNKNALSCYDYISFFGDVPVSTYLLDGLIASLTTIVKTGDYTTRVQIARQTLDHAIQVKEYMKNWSDYFKKL